MASSINASVSGAGGLISTADASGVLQLQTASTTAVTIDASQNVGIGTTSPAYGLHVSGTGTKSYVRVSNTSGTYNAKFNVEDTGETTFGAHSNNPLLLLTNNIERMRIDSSGNVGINTASPATKLSVSSADANVIATFANTGATPYGLLTDFTSDPNNATNYGYKFRLTNNTNIYTIFSNGTVSARSDERFKKDIETTRDGYAEDLSKLRVVKYRWHNAEEDSPKELGFIAQEVEQVFPGLISTEMNDDGIDVKSIKTSVFVPMLVKAIQEQQTIINDLKARVTALEAK